MKAAVVEKFGSVVVREIAEPKMGDYDALCELLYGRPVRGRTPTSSGEAFPGLGNFRQFRGMNRWGA